MGLTVLFLTNVVSLWKLLPLCMAGLEWSQNMSVNNNIPLQVQVLQRHKLLLLGMWFSGENWLQVSGWTRIIDMD